jgi:hypothetical protein
MQYFEYNNSGYLTKDIFIVDTSILMGYQYEYSSGGVVAKVTFIGEKGTINAIWDIVYDSNGLISGFNSSSTQSIGTYHWGPYIQYKMDNNGNWISRIRTSKITDEKIYKHIRTIEYF